MKKKNKDTDKNTRKDICRKSLRPSRPGRRRISQQITDCGRAKWQSLLAPREHEDETIADSIVMTKYDCVTDSEGSMQGFVQYPCENFTL